MARPKSMTDFANLFDANYSPLASLPEKEHKRKKPSISLAAGLIMASEAQSPRMPYSPQHANGTSKGDGAWNEGLFYAYAQKSDYAQSPPYVLTFATAAVAEQWWNLVKTEYPGSTRMGPQLFILKGDDMQEQIQDNPRFYDLRNKWFYTPCEGGVIPLQDWKGNPVAPAQAPAPVATPEEKKDSSFDMSKLSETLDKMNNLISENSAQIRALSVAQSEGLQCMQEINESNASQIKALADGQAKLQELMGQNSGHYIALSNSSFANQEQVKNVLQTNAEQIHALAEGQQKLTNTCMGLMRTIENLGSTVGQMGSASEHSVAPFGSMANRIQPPPRKLNRRVKGVWYEYDTSPSPSPGRSVGFLDTPPKSPVSTRN